jgi:23S rRNA (adenine-N6)-dimethyltransferase
VSGHGRRTRRDWGWHRLRPEWATRVVEQAPLRAGDLVLDLGAGEGALTGPLAEAGVRVLAVELHERRVERLRERFAEHDVTVVHRDLDDLWLPRRPFRVVASPPYGRTTELVRLLLGSDRLLSADLVVQRSAARRLVERPPRARRARRARLELGLSVPRKAFDPEPQVDSVVLRIRR